MTRLDIADILYGSYHRLILCTKLSYVRMAIAEQERTLIARRTLCTGSLPGRLFGYIVHCLFARVFKE